MRVFCHEHKRGFFAPRQSPIKCENSGHVLGELDFAGQVKGGQSSFPFQWQYCCNCEHFCLINFDDGGLQRCPVCTRKSSTLYLCDRCLTVSFESNTPLETKNFTLTAEGTPFPCCPGCLQPETADLREHSCDDAHVSFITGLNSCPICKERLDIGPEFPSTVAQYLKRTKSANKLVVTFDYESGLFVPVQDGEFILISDNDETNRTYVLPRSPRLEALRDFYELYQDYYHCAIPAAGEITISHPAVVVPMTDGWKLLAPGTFIIAGEPQKKKIPAAVPPPAAEPQRETKVTPPPAIPRKIFTTQESTPQTEDAVMCTYCDTLIEAKYAFCWKCGSARDRKKDETAQPNAKSDQPRPKRSRLIVSAMEEDEQETRTVQTDLQKHRDKQTDKPDGGGWLTRVANEPPSLQPRVSRSVLKLLGVGMVGLLLISLSVLALRRTSSTSTSAANKPVQPIAQTKPATQVVAATTPAVEMKPATLRTGATDVGDKVLEQLQQMRERAADRAKVLQNLSETEMKFADDYRVPYERARVVVMDHKKNFHEEAFAALARAAQKAINKGKASEMLLNLNKDSDGDFQKLAHGHREWVQLQRALKSQDASVLSANEGL